MDRPRLEEKLDNLFTDRLTDRGFLTEIYGSWRKRIETGADEQEAGRLAARLAQLRQRRNRILETFYDGMLSREERDLKLAEVDTTTTEVQAAILRLNPAPEITPAQLAGILAPFLQWRYLTIADKRRLLAAMAPDIRVADYHVSEVGLRLVSNEDSRSRAATTTTAPATVIAHSP
jgi:hypothetical protein